ncbi:DUF262 domain-containing protein [Xylella fastidiosa]|uniref:DUF262 domain-containing protein n=1 Tax=Xylella fastidiosa TaxID=2371 RepID=UPI002B4ADBE5|nr:DUF262 domain-containing protein [Xylella fastidiosa]
MYRLPPLQEHQNDTPSNTQTTRHGKAKKKDCYQVRGRGFKRRRSNRRTFPKDRVLSHGVFRGTFGQKMNNGDFIIPTYQREDTWEHHRKSRFIESLILGLPIPFLFLAYPHQPLDEAHSAPG